MPFRAHVNNEVAGTFGENQADYQKYAEQIGAKVKIDQSGGGSITVIRQGKPIVEIDFPEKLKDDTVFVIPDPSIKKTT